MYTPSPIIFDCTVGATLAAEQQLMQRVLETDTGLRNLVVRKWGVVLPHCIVTYHYK
jgi:hypothetical protein